MYHIHSASQPTSHPPYYFFTSPWVMLAGNDDDEEEGKQNEKMIKTNTYTEDLE